MIKYKTFYITKMNDKTIDEIYNKLLKNKWSFATIKTKEKTNILTKEKSIFEIDNEQIFLHSCEQDIYYKTTIINKNIEINQKDLKTYKKYINKFKDLFEKKVYGDKYIFGSIAVKSENGFITTIRGKKDLNDYTFVYGVNHTTHSIEVVDKKATLNAPLLDYLFKNDKVKIIVHINHQFDDQFPYFEYAFPGTVRDSIRETKTSFNIKYHGIIYLFDKNGKLL